MYMYKQTNKSKEPSLRWSLSGKSFLRGRHMCRGRAARRVTCVLGRRLERLEVNEGRPYEVGGLNGAKFQIQWEATDRF